MGIDSVGSPNQPPSSPEPASAQSSIKETDKIGSSGAKSLSSGNLLMWITILNFKRATTAQQSAVTESKAVHSGTVAQEKLNTQIARSGVVTKIVEHYKWHKHGIREVTNQQEVSKNEMLSQTDQAKKDVLTQFVGYIGDTLSKEATGLSSASSTQQQAMQEGVNSANISAEVVEKIVKPKGIQ